MTCCDPPFCELQKTESARQETLDVMRFVSSNLRRTQASGSLLMRDDDENGGLFGKRTFAHMGPPITIGGVDKVQFVCESDARPYKVANPLIQSDRDEMSPHFSIHQIPEASGMSCCT